MRFPDCRTDKDYNEKFLNEKDTEFVRGYDWCLEMAVDNLFDNLEILDRELVEILNTKLPSYLMGTYVIEDSFNSNNEQRELKTFGDLLRKDIIDYTENHRDELITSMIDNMDDEEYENCKNKALNNNN